MLNDAIIHALKNIWFSGDHARENKAKAVPAEFAFLLTSMGFIKTK